MSARKIQRRAVVMHSASVVFSARDITPGRASPSCSSGIAAPFGTPAVITTIAQHAGTISSRYGTPNIIHCANVTVGMFGNSSFAAPRKIRFVGVPIGVPMPPSDAAYATPSSVASAVRFSFPSPLTTATAMGVIIRVVAVFEIHIDRNAVTRITANTIRRGSVPTRLSAKNAMRRCSPQRSNVAETRKPPRKRKTAELA
jgi:hypothetical protein